MNPRSEFVASSNQRTDGIPFSVRRISHALTLKYLVGVSCIVALLSILGCATVAGSENTNVQATPQESMATLLEQFGTTATTPTEGEVQSHDLDDPESAFAKTAPWLFEKTAVRYNSLPARTLIELLTNPNPVTFVFAEEPNGNPIINSIKLGPDATVLDYMKAICIQSNWAFTVKHSTVVVSDIETRSFQLRAQPGNMTAGMSLHGLGAGTSSGTISSSQTNFAPYETELLEVLEAVLGIDEGGASSQDLDPRLNVTLIPTANTVVVTARPDQMRSVGRMIDEYNHNVSRIVKIHLTVYEIQANTDKSRGVTMDLVRDAAIESSFEIATQSTGTSSGGITLKLLDLDDRWNGSELVLGWLNTFSDATIVFEDTIETRNNIQASVAATRTQQFIASITQPSAVSTVGGVPLVPTVEFNELRTGWSLAVQPTISQNDVTVRLAISRSMLVEERPYQFGELSGTTFVTQDSDRMLTVTMQDGETRILSTSARTEESSTRNRVPWLPFLGDGSQKLHSSSESLTMLRVELL